MTLRDFLELAGLSFAGLVGVFLLLCFFIGFIALLWAISPILFFSAMGLWAGIGFWLWSIR